MVMLSECACEVAVRRKVQNIRYFREREIGQAKHILGSLHTFCYHIVADAQTYLALEKYGKIGCVEVRKARKLGNGYCFVQVGADVVDALYDGL
jgi:hypothetical protein